MLVNVNLFKIKHSVTAFQVRLKVILLESPWAGKKRLLRSNLFKTHRAGCLSFVYLALLTETNPIFQ